MEKKHDLKAGIETLRRFVKNKGKKKDEHVADALFNIACYYSLEIAKESEAPKIKLLTEQGYKALEAAFAIKPGIVADAKTDPDLEALRATHALEPLFSKTGDTN